MKRIRIRQFVDCGLLRALVLCVVVLSMALLPSCTTVEEKSQEEIYTYPLKFTFAKWCFDEHWDFDEMIEIAKDMGCYGIDLVSIGDPNFLENWDKMRKNGLKDGLHFAHGFDRGLNDRKNHAECQEALIKAIAECSKYGFKTVLTFSGPSGSISREDGIANCVRALTIKCIKKDQDGNLFADPNGGGILSIMKYAELNEIDIAMELLNSRINIPMKGHPDQMADNLEFIMEVVKQVNSPNMGVVYDFYHAHVMGRDLFADLDVAFPFIKVIHTAGYPGRHEIGRGQEIDYPALVRELSRRRFEGPVCCEGITSGDPPDHFKTLTEAKMICDGRLRLWR